MRRRIFSGVYRYSEQLKGIEYLRPGAFLHDLQHDDEFILIDRVPREGQAVQARVSRLCKLIFRRGIASTSYEVKPYCAEIIEAVIRFIGLR